MQAKDSSEYNIPGYRYKNQLERHEDFDKAEDCFTVSGTSTKLMKRSGNTHHSFIHYPNITVAIAYGKIHENLSSGFIGNGAFGRVKFAIDRDGKPYALKVQSYTKNGKNALQIEKEVRIATKCGLMIAAVKHGNKSYSLQHYKGPNLRKVLQKSSLSTPAKYNRARKLCYLLFKLHYQHEVTHGDIKPENITLSETDNVSFIDYGGSDDMYNNAFQPETETYHYQPYPLQKKETNDNNHPESQKLMHSLRLTRTNHDLFALIRVLCMPDYTPEKTQKDKVAGIFNPLEYQDLPEFLKDMLNTDNDHLSHVVERIAQQEYESEIVLTLAIYFITLEFEINIAIETLTIVQKHEICVCVNYLDELKKIDQAEFAAFRAKFKTILSNYNIDLSDFDAFIDSHHNIEAIKHHNIEAELSNFRSEIERKLEKTDAGMVPFKPKKATRPSAANQALSKSCAFLEKNNLLTAKNLKSLKALGGPWESILKLLTLLDDHNVVLTPENFELIMQNHHKISLFVALLLRFPKGLLTQEYFKLIVSYQVTKLEDIQGIISLCPEEYFKLMIIEPPSQLETLNKILALFKKPFIHENFKTLLDHKDLVTLYEILFPLSKVINFNNAKEQVKLIIHHPNIDILYSILKVVPGVFILGSLQSILTCQQQKELDIFLNMLLRMISFELTLETLIAVIKHKNIEALTFSLLFLNKTNGLTRKNLLTQENLTSVLSHSYLKNLNHILWLVIDEPRFFQAEFEFIVKHDKPFDLYLFINLLDVKMIPIMVIIAFILVEPQRSLHISEVHLKLENQPGDITTEDVKSLFSESNQTASGVLPPIERPKSSHTPRIFSEPKETPTCTLPPITPRLNASK